MPTCSQRSYSIAWTRQALQRIRTGYWVLDPQIDVLFPLYLAAENEEHHH
jgi:hypothetical protein